MESQSCQLAFSEPQVATPLRLLFDGRKLGDGGIGVYIENTVSSLLDAGDVSITVIGSRAQAERVPWRSDVAWLYDSSKQYSFREYVLLPRRIDFRSFDLYHAPHYTLPFGITIPSVVTIHDLIHIDHPQSFYYPLVAKRLIRSAVARASKVVAVSQDTRRALLNLTAVDPSKVVHIPNAIPPFLHDEAAPAERLAEVRAATSMPLASGERYFVTVVSNCKPHKGVADLLCAWSEFVERYNAHDGERPCPQLLVVGYGAEAIRSDRKLCELAERAAGVRILGSVGSDLLRYLYRGAEALVVPSLAEGFCFPALEAQSVGTRVICRPVPALQELVTEYDRVARDLSVTALTESLLEVASRPKEAKTVIAAHLERFSLARTAQQLRTVYGVVMEQRRQVYAG